MADAMQCLQCNLTACKVTDTSHYPLTGQQELNLVLADLFDHGLILLFGHAREVARQ